MKNLICTNGKEIKPVMIESLMLMPSIDFIGANLPKKINLHIKGEKFLKEHFWSKRKACDNNMYSYMYHNCSFHYSVVASAKRIVESITNQKTIKEKSDDFYYYGPWAKYFNGGVETRKKQVEYNKEKDCIRKKCTIMIRTKSGEILFSVFENDDAAIRVMSEFNSINYA